MNLEELERVSKNAQECGNDIVDLVNEKKYPLAVLLIAASMILETFKKTEPGTYRAAMMVADALNVEQVEIRPETADA